MPWIGDAPSNGLKLSVRVSSGEDSMTSAGAFEVLPLAVLEPLPPVLGVVLLDEEQAARPAPRSMTAPAATALLLRILLVVNFDLSSRVVRIREGVMFLWLGGAARQRRGSDVQSPARRRPVRRQQLESGVLLLAFVNGKRAPVAERAAGGGRADVAGPDRTASGAHVRGLEHGAQVVRVGGGGDEELGVGVRRTLGDVLGRAPFHDLPAVH